MSQLTLYGHWIFSSLNVMTTGYSTVSDLSIRDSFIILPLLLCYFEYPSNTNYGLTFIHAGVQGQQQRLNLKREKIITKSFPASLIPFDGSQVFH